MIKDSEVEMMRGASLTGGGGGGGGDGGGGLGGGGGGGDGDGGGGYGERVIRAGVGGSTR